MRYSVHGRQPWSVIKKADEIYFTYQDVGKIIDLIEKYPEKRVVLEIDSRNNSFLDWRKLEVFKEKLNNFHIALNDISLAPLFKEKEYNWFYSRPIKNYFDLNIILDLRPSFVFIGAQLVFDLPKVKALCGDIPLRMVPNVAVESNLPPIALDLTLCGPWVRPEDVPLYEEYIDTFVFDELESLKHEENLFTIYSELKEWVGLIAMLITGLKSSVVNAAIKPELAKARISCGQACMRGSNCHLCKSGLEYSSNLYDLYRTLKKENN